MNTVLRAGVIIDEPYINPTYNQTSPTYPPFKNLQLRGVEFELFYKIWIEILGFKVQFIEFATIQDLIQAMVTSQVDITTICFPLLYLHSTFRNWSVSSVIFEDRVQLVYKPSCIPGFVSLLSVVSPYLLLATVSITAGFVLLDFVNTRHRSNASPMFSQGLWFMIITALLGLFSNLITVKLTTPNRLRMPFRDMQDMVDKIKSRQCRLLATTTINQGSQPGNDEQWSVDLQRLLKSREYTKVVKTRTELAQIVAHDKCAIGVDYTMYPFYQEQNCALDTFNYPGSMSLSLASFYNPSNITSQKKKQIQSVFAEPAVQQYMSKIRKIYFSRSANRICDAPCTASTSPQQITIFKVAEPFFLLLLGSVVGVVMVVYENRRC